MFSVSIWGAFSIWGETSLSGPSLVGSIYITAFAVPLQSQFGSYTGQHLTRFIATPIGVSRGLSTDTVSNWLSSTMRYDPWKVLGKVVALAFLLSRHVDKYCISKVEVRILSMLVMLSLLVPLSSLNVFFCKLPSPGDSNYHLTPKIVHIHILRIWLWSKRASVGNCRCLPYIGQNGDLNVHCCTGAR